MILLKASMNIRRLKILDVNIQNQYPEGKKLLAYKILPDICGATATENVRFCLKESGKIEKEDANCIAQAIQQLKSISRLKVATFDISYISKHHTNELKHFPLVIRAF